MCIRDRHLPGQKIVDDVSRTRMIPEGSDAISPAPHHDIYSIEDLRQLVYSLKEATDYKKPVIVKIAAVHNVAAIASGIARSGADIIAIDGFRGGTCLLYTSRCVEETAVAQNIVWKIKNTYGGISPIRYSFCTKKSGVPMKPPADTPNIRPNPTAQ